jgi:hypothetical protein
MCLMISLSLREASLDKNFAAAFAMMYPLHTCTHPKTKNAWDLHTFPHHSFFGLDLSLSTVATFGNPPFTKNFLSVEGCYFWQPLPLWRTLWVEVLYLINVEDGMTILVWGQVAAVGIEYHLEAIIVSALAVLIGCYVQFAVESLGWHLNGNLLMVE